MKKNKKIKEKGKNKKKSRGRVKIERLVKERNKTQ